MVEESEVNIRERVEIPDRKDAFKTVQTSDQVRSGVQKTVQAEGFELNGNPPRTPEPERTDVVTRALERAGTQTGGVELSKLEPEILESCLNGEWENRR